MRPRFPHVLPWLVLRHAGRSRSCGSSLSSACSTPRSARCSPLSAAHSSGNLSAAASSAGGDTPITVVVHVRPLVEREHSSGSCIDGNDRQGRDALSPEVRASIAYAAYPLCLHINLHAASIHCLHCTADLVSVRRSRK